jgi:hypothetical protein
MNAAKELTVKGESRRAPRERVMLSAKLTYQSGSVSVPCVVSQISESGARISVSADVVLAQTMRLDVPQRNINADVRLVWRRGGMAAVAFEPTPPALKAPLKAANKDGLEEENQRLRELVVQLEQRLKQMKEGF